MHLSRLRLQATLTTAFSAAAFIQYNSAADIVVANMRLRYNAREGNDLYVVFNTGLNTDRGEIYPPVPMTSTRALIVKYTHTFIL